MSDELLGFADLVYDAASGGASWAAVGRGLERLVDATSASLMAGDFSTGTVEILYHADIPATAARCLPPGAPRMHSRCGW